MKLEIEGQLLALFGLNRLRDKSTKPLQRFEHSSVGHGLPSRHLAIDEDPDESGLTTARHYLFIFRGTFVPELFENTAELDWSEL